jgi:hypothetical protein
VRAIALFGAGSAAVHQLRYAVGYGDGAQHALAAHPHEYLSLLLPGLITAALITFAAGLLRAARGGATTPRRRLPLLALWLLCTVALASVFATQETLEGASAFAHGGWIGLVLAIPVGLVVALGLRGAEAAELRPLRIELQARVLHVARLGIAAVRAYPRVVGNCLGARAPPQPCVV